MSDPHLILGVDIGGTFTDVICLDPRSGEVTITKTPTTLPNRADGMINGIRELCDDRSRIATIIHGTTMATNAVLERKIASIALLTTQGFRDVLEMRRRQRPRTYGLTGEFQPLVPRNRRYEIRERVAADGSVLEELREDDVLAAIEDSRSAGAEAVALCFINSFAHSGNEERAASLVRKYWPEAFVSASSRVLPELQEFERTSTTVLNAAVQPVIDRYLQDVEGKLAASGCAAQLSIVQSNGGIASVAATRQKPVTTILSGPAAGVTGANYVAGRAGFEDIVTFDMGGTSLDAAVVVGGKPHLSSQTTIDFGVVMNIPMIQMTTIGAGGGSIAHIDAGGFLQIGPESAGSNPGPVAYGRGGTRATVTDSNIVMGRINPQRPIGKDARPFDVEAASNALQEQVGQSLKLSAHAAAEAVVAVANTKMAGAVRLATIEKGLDPRRFTLVAFGGAGPLHAGAMLKEVGIARALVPYFPGLTSAMGCAVGDVQYDLVQTFNDVVSETNLGDIAAIWRRQEKEGNEVLATGNHFVSAVHAVYSADMQYQGQIHSIRVTFDRLPASAEEVGRVFRERYRATFGMNLNLPATVTSVRTSVIGTRQRFDLFERLRDKVAGSRNDQPVTRRPVWFNGGFVDTPVYERPGLQPGTRIPGPAILEQPDSTVLVDPGLTARVDKDLNVILEASA